MTTACDVYCYGKLLEAVQMNQVFNDSKTFVDMPMKYDPEVILLNFDEIVLSPISSIRKQQLTEFVTLNFNEAGSDLLPWIPSDFRNLTFDNISNPGYKVWAQDLNKLWVELGRQQVDDVQKHPQRYSLFPKPKPFIVPGGRFRENYYWDSLFIIQGLLVCEMATTALNMIENFIEEVNTIGFIPNGGRVYYEDRSQPPLLSEMVVSYMNYMMKQEGSTELETQEQSKQLILFLSHSFAAMEKEYKWWMNYENGHVVRILGYEFNRYNSANSTPRPESYREDYLNAHMPNMTQSQEDFYMNIRAAAESGWDFSSRWIRETCPNDLTCIETTTRIPVDLNSYMHRYELNLALIASYLVDNFSILVQTVTGEPRNSNSNSNSNSNPLDYYSNSAERYLRAADARRTAINSLMWSDDVHSWKDLIIPRLQEVGSINPDLNFDRDSYTLSSEVTISSWVPLYGKLGNDFEEEKKRGIVQALNRSGLIQEGGILTTLRDSGQQWDAPNAWPPLVLLTIEGLNEMGLEEASGLAANISSTWLNTCYIAYEESGFMYEKYDAYSVGTGGGGGEYTPQTGFGWSNGVALVLLARTV